MFITTILSLGCLNLPLLSDSCIYCFLLDDLKRVQRAGVSQSDCVKKCRDVIAKEHPVKNLYLDPKCNLANPGQNIQYFSMI